MQPSGVINLIYRAPLDMSYQHQIDFKSPSEQRAYWGSLVKYRLTDYIYTRRERRFIKVNKSFDDLEGINYLTYQASTSKGTKHYFCFVTDKAFVNDETTILYFEIDVFQTFMFDYSFKPSYISQAHVDRWTADHKPIYSRTDEGLNYGTEYVTEKAYKIDNNLSQPYGFYVIYFNTEAASFFKQALEGKTASLRPTIISGNEIPYLMTIVPHFYGTSSQPVCGFVRTIEKDTNIAYNMHEIFAQMANSAAGKYIAQIGFLKYLPFEHTIRGATAEEAESGLDYVFEFPTVNIGRLRPDTAGVDGGGHYIEVIKIDAINDINKALASMDIFKGLEEKLPTSAQWEELKAKPRTTERDRRFESKLLTHPYRYNIFTDWNAPPVMVKNEYIGGEKITIKASMGFGINSPRRYWVDNYRGDPYGREVSINQLLPLEQPVINDAYYSYMLENRNQLSANLTNAKVSAITGGVMSIASGAASGGVAGAITSGLTSGINSAVSISNMLRSDNAKQADIKNLPDTIASCNDATLAIADEATYLTFYRKAICCEFEEQLAQYWHMFGYKVNRLDVPNIRSRVRYNFIKTIGANIEGAIEASYMTTLKAIFDGGVTIWHYSDTDFNPLDYSYENPEVNLI